MVEVQVSLLFEYIQCILFEQLHTTLFKSVVWIYLFRLMASNHLLESV